MLTKQNITYLVVHCADTSDDAELRASDIHEMHLGFGWDGAGYHYIICRDGVVESGRPLYWQGAHVYGQNENSLGICLIGRSRFTDPQTNSLSRLLHKLKCRYPEAEIVGHRDIQDTDKTCPNFDVRSWWQETSLFVGQSARVVVPYTGLYASPPEPGEEHSVLDTELLSGEGVTLSNQTTSQGFVFLTAHTDGYQGWVKLADLGRQPEAYHPNAFVCRPQTVITAGPDVKSTCVAQIPFAARLFVSGPAESGFVPISMLDNAGLIISGFAPESDVFMAESVRIQDWVRWAQAFVGAPYKWGGRTAAGLDCSALVQLSLAASGHSVPRDTGPQVKMFEGGDVRQDSHLQKFTRGDLVYWDGHVVICLDADNIIHASAHHHAVVIEPREQAMAQITKASGPPVAHIGAEALQHHLADLQ